MYKKKWLGLFLILIMALGMLSGCSPIEKEYLNISMEASKQQVYESNGSMELDMVLPEEMFEGEEDFTKGLVQKALDEHRIDFWSKSDINQGVFQYDFAIVNKKTGEKDGFLTVIYQNNVLYMKVDEIISFLKEFCSDEEKQEIDKVFKDTKYISWSDKDIETMMGLEDTDVFKGNFMKNARQQQMIQQRLLEVLINDVYDKYDSDLISKNNNEYTFRLRGSKLVDSVKPVAIYTVNNIDKLGSALKTFVNGLSQEEIKNLGLTSKDKEEILIDLDDMVIDVNENRSKYLKDIEETASEAKKDLNGKLDDCEFVSTVKKVDDRTYNSSAKFHINMTDEDTSKEADFTITAKQTIKTGVNVQVTAPKDQVTSINEIENRMPKTMIVWIDDGYYSLDGGFSSTDGCMDVNMINNQAYLPLRQVAEELDEKVGWDETSKQAYIERNGQRIIIAGVIVEGETLIKSRDLEKLGYQVSWDALEGTIIIEKNRNYSRKGSSYEPTNSVLI